MAVTINGDNFNSSYAGMPASTLVYMKHQLDIAEPWRRILDVFSGLGSLTIARVTPNHVQARRGHNTLNDGPKNCSRVGLFIPFFSILDWLIKPGVIDFEAWIFTDQAFDQSLFNIPMEPSAFAVTGDVPEIRQLKDIASYLNSQTDLFPIGRGFNADPRCALMKKLIDENFRSNDFAFANLELALSQEAMIRYFKRDFGITPLAYRNRLRIAEAYKMFLTQKSGITDTAYEVGFNDLSGFIHNFKRVHSVKPSNFIK